MQGLGRRPEFFQTRRDRIARPLAERLVVDIALAAGSDSNGILVITKGEDTIKIFVDRRSNELPITYGMNAFLLRASHSQHRLPVRGCSLRTHPLIKMRGVRGAASRPGTNAALCAFVDTQREQRIIQGNLKSLDCHDLYSLSFLVSILSSLMRLLE